MPDPTIRESEQGSVSSGRMSRTPDQPQWTRLAPSPTGALHLGNARTFLINWALARQHDWGIILRIEDLDTPRIKPGAIEETIDTLRWLGIDWDEGPFVQSRDMRPYEEAMDRLARQRLVFPCALTRSQIEASASAPQEGVHEVRFPPELRPAERPGRFTDRGTNWRVVIEDREVRFLDAFLGEQVHRPAATVGDFVVWTRRGQPSYQLAVVVDDARQAVTQIVRGSDLLDSAARQILLYEALRVEPRANYWHLPIVVGEDGRRLAKRHGDTRLTHYRSLGVRPERIIALIARWSGVDLGSARELSAQEFRSALDLRRMSRETTVFRSEDEAWILAN